MLLSANLDDLDSIFSAVERARGFLSADVYEAVVSAVYSELDNVESAISGEDSESTLEEQRDLLQRLGLSAGASASKVSAAVVTINARIEEIRCRTPDEAEAPRIVADRERSADKFDNDDVRSLFSSLMDVRGY